jgi:class 3 adenylate cyclase
MDSTVNKVTVMFADISGSTRLYEKLGDQRANAIISEVISLMREVTEQNNGKVIKTIGDEVMCRFYRVDDAINAACAIQEHIDGRPTEHDVDIGVHIGLHWGPAIIKPDGDLFGDAVNVAARMTGIARSRQIITTEATALQLSPELREKSRAIDRAHVKGKADEIVIYEFLWESEDVTRLSFASGKAAKVALSPLVVQYGEQRKVVSRDNTSLSFGRGTDTDIVIPSDLASRQHARIEYRQGKYVLVDHSTNGTFVRTEDGHDIYLHREELPLQGRGIISLGEEIRLDKPGLVHYRI